MNVLAATCETSHVSENSRAPDWNNLQRWRQGVAESQESIAL